MDLFEYEQSKNAIPVGLEMRYIHVVGNLPISVDLSHPIENKHISQSHILNPSNKV